MEIFRGQGTIEAGGKRLCAGTYMIVKLAHPEKKVLLTGTIAVDGLVAGDLANRIESGAIPQDLTLIIQDGREFGIHLVQQPGRYDIEAISARFSLIFAPGSLDILNEQTST